MMRILPFDMRGTTLKKAVYVFAVPTIYAIVMRLLFGVRTWDELFGVMTITFLFCLPVIVGILTVHLSGEERARSWSYRFFAPWVPIFFFFLITLALSIEGWACWLMILPLFLLCSSMGGFIGGRMRRSRGKGRLQVSAVVLLPFLAAPVEHIIGTIPGTYEVRTAIDIHASAERIWSNVTRVATIRPDEDHGWLTRALGMPRPLEAILDVEGVGGRREARFTKGLVFHETVLAYEEGRRMVFSIRADPQEIPSTTMDEHIVVGGSYFNVLTGTYELERIDARTCRLHLQSRFRLNTDFNFYAGLWAGWIMQDIQRNILHVQKLRAEAG